MLQEQDLQAILDSNSLEALVVNQMTVEGAAAQTQQAPPPQEAPKAKGTLPKGF